LRLRIDFGMNVRKAMISGIMPPSEIVVSVPRKIDYDVADYTVDGLVDDKRFSLNTLTRYVEELESYLLLLDSITEAAFVVILWRGHFPFNFFSRSFNLPLHSITVRQTSYF
jgi:hypothetical protein